MYSKKVIDCFYDPQYVGVVEGYSARGFVGSVECGDAMELTVRIMDGVVVEARHRTYGCTAAIASCEALVALILGKKISEISKISNSDIVSFLNGLPALKIHCSVMGEELLKSVVKNYLGETGELDEEIICKCNMVSRRSLESMILQHRVFTYGKLQQKLSVGTVCEKCKSRIYQILGVVIERENDLLRQ